MKKVPLIVFLSVLLISCRSKEVVTDSASFSPVDYVNPLVGTLSKFTLSTGNTYPAIALPWGMNFWTPQTGDMGYGWTYCYTDDKIKGFKQTHQPSPWINDYGQFSLMPVTGAKKFLQNERGSWFSHKAETARPYYYSAYLADHDVKTEITPTERSAYFMFTFPESEDSYIVVDAFDNGSFIQIDEEHYTITGYTTKNSGGVPDNFRNYFVMKFDKPFVTAEVWSGDKIIEGKKEVKDNHVGAVLGFRTSKGEKIGVKVSSSFINEEQAWLNLEEIGSKDFNEVKGAARDAWNDVMNKVRVEGGTDEQLRTFYSCLYRSLLFPRKFYEIDKSGNIVHYSPYNGEVKSGYMYTDTGFWDTFRALFPFLNLMYPSVNKEIQEGLANTYKESGFLPEWASPGHRDCMVGNNSASVVADAYIKGLRGYDIETLWEALKHGANAHLRGTASGRLGYESYNQLGYVANNIGIGQNVARTLEYAYNDWAIYTLGKKLGKPESEIDIYKKHALNYKNVYHPERKLMVGKDNKGVFNPNFDAVDWSGEFCEGNSWHWSFCVFHDPQGLINLMGGKKEFNAMMDSVFVIPGKLGMESRGMIHEMREMQVMNMGQYAHGNQPIQHMIYLYNYAGEPWKAQYWLREVMNRLYFATPDGYCGDEDNGQTSAWYVFTALGFYPVCPGSNEYVMGAPYFKKATITLENGKKLEISAPKNNDDNRYIRSLNYNGKNYTKNYLNHFDLLKGGRLVFDMDNKPNKGRGINESDFPYSFSRDAK